MNDTTELFLAVPGPEQMKPFPIHSIREGLSSGEIEPSRLAWSEADASWKPLQEMAHLLGLPVKPDAPKNPEPVAPVAAKKPIDIAPISTSKPIDITPISTAKPIELTPISTSKSIDVTPISSSKPTDSEPIPFPSTKLTPSKASKPASEKAEPATSDAKTGVKESPGRPSPLKADQNPLKMDMNTMPIDSSVKASGAKPSVATGKSPKVGSTTAAVPKPKVGSTTAAVPKPKVGGATGAVPKPKVGGATAGLPMKDSIPRAPLTTAPIKEEDHKYHYILRWVAIWSFIILVSLVGVNYFFVDLPFQSSLTANGLNREVVTLAHFGGFYQQDIIVIHLLPGPGVTKTNFLGLLVTIAKSTPFPPIQSSPFRAVSVTPGWTSHYIFKGDDWVKLGNMNNASDNQRIVHIVNSLQDTNGKPFLDSDENAKNVDSPNFQLDDREKRAWNNFLEVFTAGT